MVNIKYKNISAEELLSSLEDKSIDFILTDPPYELDLNGGGSGSDFSNRKLIKDKHLRYVSEGFDVDSIFTEFERVLKVVNLVVFCSNKQVSKIMSWWESRGYATTLLIWQKPNPIPLGNNTYINDVEFMVYVRGKGATFNNIGYSDNKKVFTYPYPTSNERIHPTEKPVELLKRLIRKHTNKEDVVLDVYAGSFTTGIACYEEGRNCIMSEIDTEMFKKASERIEIKMLKNNLFN